MDTREPVVQYNFSGKKREEEDKDHSTEVVKQGLRRQSINRIIWLDQKLELERTPPNTFVSLIGIFDVETRHSIIYVVIDHNLTEYRLTRWNKKVLDVVSSEVDDLKYAHRNMVKHFLDKYMYKDFQTLLVQWLSWNNNPAYHAVLGSLSKST